MSKLKLGQKTEGGTIFWINEDHTSGLIMSDEHTNKLLDWDSATKLAKDYKNINGHAGWRLPTKEELNRIYKYVKDDMIKDNCSYWSSTQQSVLRAWVQSFRYGNQSLAYTVGNACFGVYLIREFKQQQGETK